MRELIMRDVLAMEIIMNTELIYGTKVHKYKCIHTFDYLKGSRFLI